MGEIVDLVRLYGQNQEGIEFDIGKDDVLGKIFS